MIRKLGVKSRDVVYLPLVVLLGENGPDQTDEAGSVGEDAHHRCPALDLLVESLQRVGAADLASVRGRKREVGKEIHVGFAEQCCDGREAMVQTFGHPAQLLLPTCQMAARR